MLSTQGWSSAHLRCRNCCLTSCKGVLTHFLSQSGLCPLQWTLRTHLSCADFPLTQQPQQESCSDTTPRNKTPFSLLLVMSPMLEDNRECEQQKAMGAISLEAVGCVPCTWASGTPPLSSCTQERWQMCGTAIQKCLHLQCSRIPLPQPQGKLCRELPYLPSACSTWSF